MTEKILYLVQPASFFESHRLHIALAAKKLGYEIHVVTNGEPSTLSRLMNHGIKVHDLGIQRDKKGIWKEALSLWRIIQTYRTVRPNICHHVTMRMILFGVIASRIIKPRKVINAYSGLGYLFTKNSMATRVMRNILKIVMRVFGQPNIQYAIFQNLDDKKEIFENKFEVEENSTLIRGSGVDISHYNYVPEPTDGPVKIVFPARLLKDKGIIEFVETIKMVRKSCPNIYVQLAGTPDPGNPSSISSEMLDQWQEEGVINQSGIVEDMAELYRTTHIVCLPSHREGLPKSLLEASASGRPIITTDVPGCRELISLENPYSIIVPDRDVKALAAAIIDLIRSTCKRVTLGQNGRMEAEKIFSAEVVRRRTLDLYSMKN